MSEHELARAPTIGIEIPTGYQEIPLGNLAELMQDSRELISTSVPETMRDDVPTVLGALHFFLAKLVENNALYCGIGTHRTAETGPAVVSWLTISSFEYGEGRNPRLVLSDLIAAKADEGARGHLEIVELPDSPVLFFEWTEQYGRPNLSSYPSDGETSDVFQLEVTVPAEDGSSIAVIELSTADTDAGPQYRSMMLHMATSVQFPPPQPEAGSSSLALR